MLKLYLSHDYLPVSIDCRVGKPQCLAGVGGKAHVFLITWCVVYN